jgi:hypothetical protein
MASPGMLRHVALVRTDVLEKLSASFIKVTRIGELGTMLAVPVRQLLVTASVVPSSLILVTLMKDAKFLRNVGSYKSHTAWHPRRRHSSSQCLFTACLACSTTLETYAIYRNQITNHKT